jgi:hypothetical protein
VNQAAGDGDGIELKVGENLRDLDAVRDVRLARQALLPCMSALAELVGAHEEVTVETLRKGVRLRPPSGNRGEWRRRRHSSPASAKLT